MHTLARELGLCTADPTIDLVITPATAARLRGIRRPIEVIVHENWAQAPTAIREGVERDLTLAAHYSNVEQP